MKFSSDNAVVQYCEVYEYGGKKLPKITLLTLGSSIRCGFNIEDYPEYNSLVGKRVVVAGTISQKKLNQHQFELLEIKERVV